ncbi:MAG: hypothetical protein ACRBCS_02975 [Cellvibrionaceae bacterium]
MRTFTSEELREILAKHKKWLADEDGGEQADLSYSKLRGSDLRGSRIWSTTGNRKEIKSIFVSEDYPITYTSDILQIGCGGYEIEEWWNFSDQSIIKMDGKKALKFWRKWKETLKMLIEKSPAKPTKTENE